MLTFDTFKLDLPGQAVGQVNWDAFTETHRSDMATGQVEVMRQAKVSALPVGVSSIIYKEGGSFQATFSAKTLKDDYLKGISLSNFDQALSGLKPVMQVDPVKLWEANPKVFKCDTTDNILLLSIGHSQKEICQALLAGRSNIRFLPILYDSRKKLGVEFRGTQLEKNRLIAYAKNLDMLKPENRNFIKSLNNPGRIIQDAECMLRFEVNHTAFRSMKDRFGIADNSLQQVLKSSQPVNHDFLLKVLRGRSSEQLNLFDSLKQFEESGGSGEDFVRMKGIEGIVHELNSDDTVVYDFFKQVYKDNFKYQFYKRKNPIKQILANVKAKSYGQEIVESNHICNLILAALKAA